jgi:hypothetical protein
MRTFIVSVAVSISLLFLVACDGGGGGGGGSDDPVIPPTEPPTEPPTDWPADNAVTVDGNVWLQPADFTGYIFEQVKEVCPGPEGMCTGSLQGSTFDLTGYKWASIMDVSGLFNAYGVNPPFTAPFQDRYGDSNLNVAIALDFTITNAACYGDCPVGILYVDGMLRDPAPVGKLYTAGFSYIDEHFPPLPTELHLVNTGVIDFSEVPDYPDTTGIWFWKPSQKVILDSKEWLQPKDFINYSYNQVSAVCPAGSCSGALPGSTFNLTGYFWASSDDVNSLFNAYREAGRPILEDFAYTTTDLSTRILYGILRDPPREDIEFDRVYIAAVAGNEPYNSEEEVTEIADFPTRVSEASSITGVWFWRPEIDTVSVDGREWAQVDLFTNLSWNDINAVCTEGACFGTLNGHDMTGWTWAKVDDLNALFNHYVGSDVLGPGPDCYSEGHNTPWVDAFFDDGWRGHDFITGYVSVGGRLRDSADYIAFLADSWTPGMGSGGDGICTNETFTGTNDPGTGAWFYRTP